MATTLEGRMPGGADARHRYGGCCNAAASGRSGRRSGAPTDRCRSVAGALPPAVLFATAAVVFIAAAAPDLAGALKLPSYISPCKRSDPKLDECVVRHGQQAIPKFINGDPKYRVPKLDPLEITELVVNQGTKQIGLALTLKDTKIYGLRNAKFVRSKTDLVKRHIEWDFAIDWIQILGRYTVSGQVLVLPITGEGASNVTISMTEFTSIC